MRLAVLSFALALSICACAQTVATSATVPVTLDHNRVIIDVYLPLPDGKTTRVRGWVDTGNPDLWITEGLAKKLELPISGDTQDLMGGKARTAKPPRELKVGGMIIALDAAKSARVILAAESIGPGSSAEINLPSSVLRNYDVSVDYLNREFTIAAPRTLHFKGASVKGSVNPENGLIQLPAEVGTDKGSLGLDLGATVSFISGELVSKWRKQHPRWPHLTGAVGPANFWGVAEEPTWQLLRIPSMQVGDLSLTNIVTSTFSKEDMPDLEKRAGGATIGILGADALLNYGVGIDYANANVYFDHKSSMTPINFDVVGLILRPESDGRYSVIGVADYEGKPSVPDVQKGDVLVMVDGGRAKGGTMGQVWSLLGGRPGDIRTLTLERDGKQFIVKATVRHFLAPVPNTTTKKSVKKK